MTTNTTTNPTTELATVPAAAKASKKPVARKPVAKKTDKTDPKPAKAAKSTKKTTKPTEKAEKTAKPSSEIRKGSIAHRVLQQLAKKSMSRPQLSEALDGAFVGSDLMGHHDPERVKPTSLSGQKLVRAEKHDVDGKDTVLYVLTATGKKTLEKIDAA